MKPKVTLRDALSDPALLGGVVAGDSWLAWRVLMIATVGEKLTTSERAVFTKLTGRLSEPRKAAHELWVVAGRRGGKTRSMGVLAAYLACLCDHADSLAIGERGVLPNLAATSQQAENCFRHVAGIISASPVLSLDAVDVTADTIRLRTGIDIQVRVANYRTIRGISSIAAICDEIAFWNVEGSANPDREILEALRPSLATTGGPLLVISSPYARRGELYAVYRKYYGAKGDPAILVAKGSSRTFNSTLPQSVVDRAIERDPAVAAAEYLGEFRVDVEQFISRDIVEAAVEPGVHERGAIDRMQYFGFVDPSGGSSDAMTLAIAHAEGRRLVLDAVRERKPPFSPESVVAEFAELLKQYRLTSVTGDRYAGEWPREAFSRHGITYRVADKTRSELYLAVLPELNSGNVSLLDEAKIIQQFVGLERRTSRAGKDAIDHAPGQHDDLVNAIAGALIAAKPRAQDNIPIVPPILVTVQRSTIGDPHFYGDAFGTDDAHMPPGGWPAGRRPL